MFAFFPNAVGVANVREFADRIGTMPAYVTEADAGAGFAELAAFLLAGVRYVTKADAFVPLSDPLRQRNELVLARDLAHALRLPIGLRLLDPRFA